MYAKSKCLAALALGLLAGPLMAATFWVVNSNDSGPGSLRQALLDMNSASGDSHQVRFDLVQQGAIWLNSSLPPISKRTVLITGFKSPSPVVIVGGIHRVFHAPNGLGNRDLSISWLTISDVEVETTWSACIHAAEPAGAGPGTLSLVGVTLRNCRTNSNFGTASGGAVLVDDRHVSIVNSIFHDNQVSGTGGALNVRGPGQQVDVTITGSTFTDNGASGPDQPRGGALMLRNVALHLTDSRFLGNWTSYSGSSGFYGDADAAIAADQSSARIASSLFFGHTSGRGLVGINGDVAFGPVVIENSQFIDNEVGRGSVLTIGSPRGIVRNSIIAGTTTDNYVFPTAINHGWLDTDAGAGLSVHNNILIASNHGADSLCRLAMSGSPLHSQGDNLVVAETVPGCGLSINTTQDALAIEALRDNGGPVETVSLFAHSSAIAAGNVATPDATAVTA